MREDRAVHPVQDLSFLILGQYVQVSCSDDALAGVVLANYGAMSAASSQREVDLRYGATLADGGFVLTCRDEPAQTLPDAGTLLFQLEKDLTIALQERRRDLLFMHAAALAK